MLYVPRQPGGPGCAQWKTDLEDLYNSTAREADGENRVRYVEIGALRRRVMVLSHRGPSPQSDLCQHRRKLLRSGNLSERCHPGLRYDLRPPAVVATIAARRCVQLRMQHRSSELSAD